MLFSNRKLTGGAESTLKKYINQKTGLELENIAIFGIDDLDGWLAQFPHIVKMVNLSPLMISPIIQPDEFARVISHFAKAFNNSIKNNNFAPKERTEFEEKNQLNHMSNEFAKSLKKLYLSYVGQIDQFLYDAQNADLLDQYQEAVEEFQLRFIIPKQQNGDQVYFDHIFNDLVELIIGRDYILAKNRRLTRIMVFYMYWRCDIGRSKDD